MIIVVTPSVICAENAPQKYNANDAKMDPKQQLADLLTNIKLIHANFTQMIVNQSGYVMQEQAGILQLVKPNLLHWQVLTPDHNIIVSDGKKIWNYDIDLDQVTVKKFSLEYYNNKIINLLLGEVDKFLENFVVSQEDKLHFKLNNKYEHPKTNNNINAQENNIDLNDNDNQNNMGNFFTEIDLVFNKSKQLVKLSFADHMNQQTIISFSKFTNKVDRSIFNFKVPEGVDVIEDQQ
jgi:outer membrane lipoprotein carrier protein